MASSYQPAKPYLLFHPRFIVKRGNESWQYEVEEPLLETDVFKEPSFAIDIDCRKFRLKDVVKRRPVYTWWNLPLIRREKVVYVDYIFHPPEQLTFEQARDEFVEYVCSHGWWSDSYENERQFRARNAKYTSMAQVIEPVSLKGSWPRVRRKG